jgi:predicted TIM-barrel fold metal-dependent hydrolase
LAPFIKQVYDAFGAERMMWATDSPFQVVAPHTYGASIELVQEGLDFLSDTDKEHILRQTAERVFFG